MPGDYTRLSFDPVEDFSRPRAEQGRMLRDAYLNELADGVDHRLRALALDVLGPCTAPRDLDTGGAPEATGFRIAVAGVSFTIGLGRLYVHGLSLDNHGSGPWHVEPGLQDLRGADPVPYEKQPYYRNPPPVPETGPHVVYVEAWEREVTAVERHELIDSAVGEETDARMQTVWQVKVLPGGAEGVDCATPDAELPGWAAATAPSAGRLSTAGVAVPADTDPCSVPPDSGYRGFDNRLYRVEVHTGGALGDATFKWARDNASVATAVLGVDSTRTVLTVARTGRDDVQRIREGSWVEVLDEARELSGTPGFLARVVTVDRVDDPTQQVTLSGPLPADLDPTDGSLRTRLRQWDQSGASVGGDGAVPVSAATGGLDLEDGVQITFSTDPAGGLLRTGDHWTFTARSADGQVQPLADAPPQGPRRFYGRLAVVDLGGQVTDCREVWPPECDGCGDCTLCVTPESHADGRLTVQDAVDRVRRTGGRICLAVGEYELDEPVVLDAARGVTLAGHGWGTVLRHRGTGPAVVLAGCRGVTVSDLAIVGSPPPSGGENDRTDGAGGDEGESVAVGIAVERSAGVEVVRCAVVRSGLLAGGGPAALLAVLGGSDRPDADRQALPDVPETAITLVGLVAGLVVRECVLLADVGIASVVQGSPTETRRFLTLAGLQLADSVVYGTQAGILLDERVQLTAGADVRDCLIVGDQGAAVTWQAHPMQASTVIRDCRIDGGGAGIELACPDGEISRCRITAHATGLDDARGADRAEQPPPRLDGTGIVLTAPQFEGVLSAVRVDDCTITTAGPAVALQGAQRDIVVTGNRLDGGTSGVIMRPGSSGLRVLVRDNDVIRTPRPESDEGSRLAVIGVWLVQVTDGEVRGNQIHDLDPGTAERGTVVAAVAAQECPSLAIAGNTLVVPAMSNVPSLVVGVLAQTRSGRIDVIDNVIVSGTPTPTEADSRQLPAVAVTAGQAAIRTARFGVPTARRPVTEQFDASDAFARMGTDWYAEREEGLVWVTPGRVFAAVGDVSSAVTVRGNRIAAGGAAAVVQTTVTGPLVFSDNLIRRDDANLVSEIRPAAVTGSADSLIASANHLETVGTTAVELDVPASRTAVTGNVTRGRIQIGGAPLPAPWNAINVVLP
ncbi:DUF6519 domain-containing protein [Kitasatospora sp. NPDC088346]|uniref:DUF6519 domain-containing protein n=1 Tax=Kitasatospora sp. NPDC088346 TaxID=3364073 RepID=UPI0038028302